VAGRWQGPAHNPARLHSCRAFAPPIPTCPTPNASSLTLIPTALSASCLLPQLWPAPALSISRQTLELLARSARLKEADDELCLKQFTELVVLIKEVVDDRDELIAELERKLEKADRRAAQQRLANPAPPPQQHQPARAPAQHAALPVWDPAAVPMAAMSRLRAAEVSAAAAKAWAATAAAYERLQLLYLVMPPACQQCSTLRGQRNGRGRRRRGKRHTQLWNWPGRRAPMHRLCVRQRRQWRLQLRLGGSAIAHRR
jgi:hypothetical protein